MLLPCILLVGVAGAAAEVPPFKALVQEFLGAVRQRDASAALSLEGELLRLYPDEPPTHAVLAKGFMELRFQHSARAISHLHDFRRRHPQWLDAPLLLNHGYLLREAGEPEESEAAFKAAAMLPADALERSPVHSRVAAPAEYAAALLERGSRDEALLGRAAKLLKRGLKVPGGLEANPEILLAVHDLQDAALRLAEQKGEDAASQLLEHTRQLVQKCGKWLETRHAGLEVPVSPKVAQVSSRTATSPEQLRALLERQAEQRAPLLISGGALEQAWPAAAKLVDLEHLGRSAGEELVYVSCLPEDGASQPAFGTGGQRRLLRLADFLKRFRADAEAGEGGLPRRCYLNTQGKRGQVLQPPLDAPGLAADVEPLPLQLLPQGAVMRTAHLWLGGASAEAGNESCAAGEQADTSRLHHDTLDNLLAVLQGRKRVALFPPSAATELYTVGRIAALEPGGRIAYLNDGAAGEAHGVHFSLVSDAFAPSERELSRFPRLRRALEDKVEVEVRAGELLYLPAGWFHQVQSRGKPHVALNLWWEPGASS